MNKPNIRDLRSILKRRHPMPSSGTRPENLLPKEILTPNSTHAVDPFDATGLLQDKEIKYQCELIPAQNIWHQSMETHK